MSSNTRRAFLVAIEGIDGAGKGTQSELLRKKLLALGARVEVISFPRYHQTFFAESIMSYLNGGFGPLESVDPRLPALLYAGDRYESRPILESLCRDNDFVILDRYVASNMAYQAARTRPESRIEFLTWLSNLEYQVYKLPEADLTIYLDVPVDLAMKMVYQKRPRSYTTSKADIHESNTALLAACAEVYSVLAQNNVGGTWERVECVRSNGQILDPHVINEMIFRAMQTQLAPNSSYAQSYQEEPSHYPFPFRSMRMALP